MTASHWLASTEGHPSGFVALGDSLCPQLCSWSCTAAPVCPSWLCACRTARGSGTGSAGPQHRALPCGTVAHCSVGTTLLWDAQDSPAALPRPALAGQGGRSPAPHGPPPICSWGQTTLSLLTLVPVPGSCLGQEDEAAGSSAGRWLWAMPGQLQRAGGLSKALGTAPSPESPRVAGTRAAPLSGHGLGGSEGPSCECSPCHASASVRS